MAHYEAVAVQPGRETVETVLRFSRSRDHQAEAGVNGREEFQTFEAKPLQREPRKKHRTSQEEGLPDLFCFTLPALLLNTMVIDAIVLVRQPKSS